MMIMMMILIVKVMMMMIMIMLYDDKNDNVNDDDDHKHDPDIWLKKYDNLYIVAFNRIFNYDDVIQMKNKLHIFDRELSQLQHIKIWKKINHR